MIEQNITTSTLSSVLIYESYIDVTCDWLTDIKRETIVQFTKLILTSLTIQKMERAINCKLHLM